MRGMTPTAPIVVSAIVLRDAAGRILTCRKRGTSLFQFPGGKWEPGESALDAAVRETREEVGIELDPAALEFLGEFTAPAANEDGHTVHAHVFVAPGTALADAAPRPAAEIAEVSWFPASSADESLAPLLRDGVFPALVEFSE